MSDDSEKICLNFSDLESFIVKKSKSLWICWI